MKRSFKKGDSVLYGVIRGILIGIFTNDKSPQVLFFSHDPREGFQTRDQITKGNNGVIDYLIKEHFGYNKVSMHSALDQPRFAIVSLQDLKHMSSIQTTDDSQRLIRKRHLLIKMATNYMKMYKSDESVQRVCQSIENIQAEIEWEASKITSRNKSAFASYE